MFGFLKVFGRGVLYTILLPFILLIWVLFTTYNIFLFIVMFFISLVKWIRGGSPFADTKEDIEAKKILLERQNQAQVAPQPDQNKDALIAALASAVIQSTNQQNQSSEQDQNVQTYEAYPAQEIDSSEPVQIEHFENEEEQEEIHEDENL